MPASAASAPFDLALFLEGGESHGPPESGPRRRAFEAACAAFGPAERSRLLRSFDEDATDPAWLAIALDAGLPIASPEGALAALLSCWRADAEGLPKAFAARLARAFARACLDLAADPGAAPAEGLLGDGEALGLDAAGLLPAAPPCPASVAPGQPVRMAGPAWWVDLAFAELREDPSEPLSPQAWAKLLSLGAARPQAVALRLESPFSPAAAWELPRQILSRSWASEAPPGEAERASLARLLGSEAASARAPSLAASAMLLGALHDLPALAAGACALPLESLLERDAGGRSALGWLAELLRGEALGPEADRTREVAAGCANRLLDRGVALESALDRIDPASLFAGTPLQARADALAQASQIEASIPTAQGAPGPARKRSARV